MNFKNFQHRRDFLKQAASIAVAGGLPTLDTLNNVALAAGSIGAAQVGTDYKAIVCVFFYGGQDHSNVLIPYQDGLPDGSGTAATTAEFDLYATARSNNGAPATQAPGTGNLSYTRAQLAATALPATTFNSVATPGGWTTNTYGRQFALHPSYAELKAIYDTGKLAVIANVGPLIAPITRDQWYKGPRPATPLNLYSHDDQQKSWQSGTANIANPSVGIGGRIANNSTIAGLNAGAQVATQISVDGSNTFMLTDINPSTSAIAYQIGVGSIGRLQTATSNPIWTTVGVATCNTSSAFITNNDGVSPHPISPYCVSGGPVGLSGGYNSNATLKNAVLARMNATSEASSVYSDQWRQTMRQSIDTQAVISAAFVSSPPSEDIVAPFVPVVGSGSTYNSLAAELRMVASMIRASSQLGAGNQPMKRQIFFVGVGGFDTHGSEFWTANPANNAKISKAINAFWQAMGNIVAIGGGTAQDKVTLFTMSEFGRTLDSNGAGSDHGWGTHQVVLGGAVKGGKIYGQNHNVTSIPATTPVYMQIDNFAGAVPRIGLPPSPYSGTTRIASQLNHALSRGELLATTSGDAVVATVAKWFGVPPAELTGLTGVFPTLAAAHPGGSDMGFMS